MAAAARAEKASILVLLNTIPKVEYPQPPDRTRDKGYSVADEGDFPYHKKVGEHLWTETPSKPAEILASAKDAQMSAFDEHLWTGKAVFAKDAHLRRPNHLDSEHLWAEAPKALTKDAHLSAFEIGEDLSGLQWVHRQRRSHHLLW